MKKPNSDNAYFTKIADLLEEPYKLRTQRAALKLIVRKKKPTSASSDESTAHAAREKIAA